MDNAEYPTNMALPTEPGRIPGEPDKAAEVDASWLAAHEAAKRANPIGRVPAVRTPMPVSRELYPEPIYDPVEIAPLKQWVKPEPERTPRVRTWLASLLRISKPERLRVDDPSPNADDALLDAHEKLAELESPQPSAPVLSPRQEEYLQRIRAEERRIADERRTESWSRMLSEYNTTQQHSPAPTPAALAPDPRVQSARNEIIAEVERVQRRQAEEREAAARAALVEAEARLQAEHVTAVQERDERLRMAEEERSAAEAHATEAQALAEQARLAESERRAAEVRAKQTARAEQARLAEIKEREAELRRAEEERTAALALAEEKRLAAAALAELHERAEKEHRLELEKREEQLRVAEQERLAAIALAEEKTKAEEERRAELEEREERLRIAEEERLAAIALAEGAAKAEEARLAAIAERENDLRIAEEERVAAVELAAEKARSEEQRRVELAEREERLRVAEEERLAAIALAEEKSKAEAKHRAELEDREEKLRVAEEERLAAIALAEGAAKAEKARRAITEDREERLRVANERHLAELEEREERLRVAEEGRLAAIALAGERAQTEEQQRLALEEQEARLRISEEERLAAIALAEEIAESEEKRRIELAEREERLRIAEEDRLAVIARAKEDRLAAEAQAEESARVDELRRLELEERAEQLRLSEEARLAAIAQAEVARARAEAALAEAEAARLAREFEREERALAKEREREAKSRQFDPEADATERSNGRATVNGRSHSTGKSKSSKARRSPPLGRGARPTRRGQRRRRPKTSKATSAPSPQAYAAPRLARFEGIPAEGMDIHTPLQPAVTVVESPADVRSESQTAAPDLGPLLPMAPHTRRRASGQAPSSNPRAGTQYTGRPPIPDQVPGPLALPQNLRMRRSELLDRRRVEDSSSRLRTVGLVAFGGSILMLAGLLATGNATRAGVWMTEIVEQSPVTGWVLGIVRPGSGIEAPAIDPTLGDYPGASAVVASVAQSFSNDLNTLATNLDVANGPPTVWMTPEYISRPSSFIEVGEYFRRLGDYAVDGPRLMPSLADADMTFRNGFSAAGLSSESLAQQAMSVYVGLQSAWNDHLAAQRTFAQMGAQFDQFLRQHEGTLTFMLGEFGHRSAAVATDASRLQVELGQAYERAKMTQSIVENRMIDLTISE